MGRSAEGSWVTYGLDGVKDGEFDSEHRAQSWIDGMERRDAEGKPTPARILAAQGRAASSTRSTSSTSSTPRRPKRTPKRRKKTELQKKPTPAPSQRGPIRPGGGSGRPNPIEERRLVGDVVYQLERTRCGDRKCRCMRDPESPGHGPYWYAYRMARTGGGSSSGAGRWVSSYIGKTFHEI